jgi:hypothetical protein
MEISSLSAPYISIVSADLLYMESFALSLPQCRCTVYACTVEQLFCTPSLHGYFCGFRYDSGSVSIGY